MTIAEILGLLMAVVVVATIADRLRIAYPILLVIAGLVVAILPFAHRVTLEPDLILLVFLPPLIYDASLDTSIRDLRTHWRPILLLAVGLVLVTMTLVAVVFHLLVPGSHRGEAIALGAVRIGPNVTIRQAGGAILVDNTPASSPYVILAVGPPNTMRETFDHSPGLQRLRLLEASYGVGVTVNIADGLSLPAGSIRDVKFAKPIGPQ